MPAPGVAAGPAARRAGVFPGRLRTRIPVQILPGVTSTAPSPAARRIPAGKPPAAVRTRTEAGPVPRPLPAAHDVDRAGGPPTRFVTGTPPVGAEGGR
ncbi:hypothetical protein AB0N31_03745 [Streptomyces sp. NPDC051051]|uniref:hypothetical protein n=1 Tax=Streptomyces sp. NPDC051051 TaxID=3155666 RepID=UPI00343C5D9F